MTDQFAIARLRMVERIRDRSVADEPVLAAIASLPRHLFLEESLWARAYGPDALPIGAGQTMSHPEVVAYMTTSLDLREGMRVLEIGSGSGYQAALLATLGAQVFTIERIAPLLGSARAAWRKLGLQDSINSRHADGRLGWPGQAPFDRVLVTAASADLPSALMEQLAPGGVLLMPMGEADRQRLQRYTLEGNKAYREDLGSCSFVPLLATTEGSLGNA